MASDNFITKLMNVSKSTLPRRENQGMLEELKKSAADVALLKSVDLSKTHVSFEGTPQKHPLDDNIVILVSNPFARHPNFYEFSVDSITYVEDLGIITDETGNTAYRARVWVKKGLPALKAEAFIV